MPMVPPKHVEEVGPEAFAENPVSAGPWKFVEWVKGDRVVLERNEDYWRGPHPVERLVFRVVPEATTRPMAMTTTLSHCSASAM